MVTQVIALMRERGVLRPMDLDQFGLPPGCLAQMYRRGLLERSGRGLYTLADGEWTEHHTLLEASRRVPNGIIGLLSALRFHELTLEMPHEVWMLVSRKARHPGVDYPVLRVFRCEPERLATGVIHPVIEGTPVPVTDVPRTVADCFKHRRQVGLDVAVQALKEALQRRLSTPADLAEAARQGRVWNLMRPYMEAIL
ncbi:type IV toxin-antitoxin system AbiEi family antitoxin domain-containing protein [Holophaga foetida]|uniref:type IV toxin-antitoxin system AbiEi family antitoxin domain-containing protein n=1 Tax=Holophaga foetida TaxID=35839 RepID=UPI0002475319|nr:type IV toxin-antitoxin system AbiEi family antitoxin domain-containing protein [Holophaga foetida]